MRTEPEHPLAKECPACGKRALTTSVLPPGRPGLRCTQCFHTPTSRPCAVCGARKMLGDRCLGCKPPP